jgi:hypothetical protein
MTYLSHHCLVSCVTFANISAAVSRTAELAISPESMELLVNIDPIILATEVKPADRCVQLEGHP